MINQKRLKWRNMETDLPLADYRDPPEDYMGFYDPSVQREIEEQDDSRQRNENWIRNSEESERNYAQWMDTPFNQLNSLTKKVYKGVNMRGKTMKCGRKRQKRRSRKLRKQ